MSIINKNLEAEFNLAPVDALGKVNEEKVNEIESVTIAKYEDLDKISKALPPITDLSSDTELDELATYAVKSYQELMELTMSVEERFAAEIAGVASNMLGHAITAKSNKITKKLKMIELQLKKQIADSKIKEGKDSGDDLPGSAVLLDRNEILAQLYKKP
jgi:hypothetical protein